MYIYIYTYIYICNYACSIYLVIFKLMLPGKAWSRVRRTRASLRRCWYCVLARCVQ